ncbi:hypothetical protein AY586_09645 [Marichromatium gracile]|uniref:Uncharacterized protein n=1 Tax=Marichromatium gracile TaxID=1048 RepID=A0ABR5VJ45_MARGR|nr:hypothetical protein AY586_09645 [Marichromatium gracile]
MSAVIGGRPEVDGLSSRETIDMVRHVAAFQGKTMMFRVSITFSARACQYARTLGGCRIGCPKPQIVSDRLPAVQPVMTGR